jgi:hypothetical protein
MHAKKAKRGLGWFCVRDDEQHLLWGPPYQDQIVTSLCEQHLYPPFAILPR